MRKRILTLALALSLLLTSCGGSGAEATTMSLRQTEGTVGVSDDGGKEIEPLDNLGLYSGYEVDTGSESYAWIDLDSVKLTKLDENSEIAITKEGRKLEIEVKEGSLFFNVTEHLADDESMNIRTSSMLVGIRGTCGWMTQNTVALLEGTVEVTAAEQSVTVIAGEMAVMTEDGTLEVKSFTAAEVPQFVLEEIKEDEKLLETIPDTIETDLSENDPTAPYADLISKELDEVLYTEWIDFVQDGKPELLVIGIWIHEWEEAPSYSDRNVKFLVFSADPAEDPSYKVYYRTLFSAEYDGLDEFSWSLVEADGRMFIEHYHIAKQKEATGPYHAEGAYYYGFNGEGDWFTETAAYTVGTTGNLYCSHSTSVGYGLDAENVTQDSDLDEFAAVRAKYREVKLLMHSPDGKSIVIDASQ